MKVVFGGQIARGPVLRVLRAMQGIELIECDEPDEVAPHVAGADVLVIANPRGNRGAPIAAALREATSTVRWIQIVSAGVDGLLSHDIPKSIPVSNQGGAAAPAVAEHAMALLLALYRRIDLMALDTARQTWNLQMRSHLKGFEGSKVGVVGFGNIGREFAKRTKGFGVEITGFSRSGAAQEHADRMYPLAELSERVGEFDALVSCLALVPETYHLIDADVLAKCKPGSLLVNVSRGEIVDPAALEAALTQGHLAGAAIDVTEPEPLPATSTLWKAPNLIVSPHVAATGGKFVSERVAMAVQENMQRFMAGQPLINLVQS